MFAATVVPRKSTGEYAAKRVVAFMIETSCGQLRFNTMSDDVLAILGLVESGEGPGVARRAAHDGREQRCICQRRPPGGGTRGGVGPRGVAESCAGGPNVAMVGGAYGIP